MADPGERARARHGGWGPQGLLELLFNNTEARTWLRLQNTWCPGHQCRAIASGLSHAPAKGIGLLQCPVYPDMMAPPSSQLTPLLPSTSRLCWPFRKSHTSCLGGREALGLAAECVVGPSWDPQEGVDPSGVRRSWVALPLKLLLLTSLRPQPPWSRLPPSWVPMAAAFPSLSPNCFQTRATFSKSTPIV